MQIAILVPIFNRQANTLIVALNNQIALLSANSAQVFCYDDCSTNQTIELENRTCAQGLKHVVYTNLTKNLGRAAIRNKMIDDVAPLAEYLLFIDCDALPVDAYFLENYLKAIQQHPNTVLCGGRAKPHFKPTFDTLLHWLYDYRREALNPEVRNANAALCFKSFNYLIPTNLALKIRMSEAFTGYGHEDTHYGQLLKDAHIPILHINNPLYHIGLDGRSSILKKNEEAQYNLLVISKISPNLLVQIKLWRAYRKTLRLPQIIRTPCFKIVKYLASQHLLYSQSPKLWVLDLYKLAALNEVYTKFPLAPRALPHNVGSAENF